MNNPTRRTFLKTSVALAAALPFSSTSGRGMSPVAASGAAPGPARGLLFDPDDLPRIRANLELPRLASVRAMLLDVDFTGSTRFLREELRLTNHVADFMRAWKLVQQCSFAHAVWGDPRQLELALLALRRLCDYRRWDYFLEGGTHTIGLQRAPEATIATCYALDWLGTSIPADLRAAVESRIADEGAPACYRTLYGLKYPDRVRGWSFDPDDDYPEAFRVSLARWPLILNATNLKVIPICGLGLAAVWFHHRHPDAGRWLELARQSARAFATMYGSDGAYDEGVSYWSYTTSHLAMFADALWRRLGIDDRELINYPGTIRYALAMAMPCAGGVIADPKLKTAYNATPKGDYVPQLDVVNFCDAGVGPDVSVAPWVGTTARDPLSHHVARHVGALNLPQAAVWYRPDAPEQPPGPELHDVRLSNDWVISRSGWSPADGVLALRSGGPANHEHADRNSVIFKTHGERLFHDPFKAAYSYTLPRWLLRQTEAHTAVLIDGRGHQYHDGREGTNASWAAARIVDFRSGPGWSAATSDATEAYALVLPEVVQVVRTAVFLKPDIVLLLDRVRLTQPRSIQLRFQVFNDDGRGEARASGDSFTVVRPLASLRAQVAADRAGVVVQTGRLALPEDEGVFPYAEVVSPPDLEHTILTAAAAAPVGETPALLSVAFQAGRWTVSGTHRGRSVHASLASSHEGAPALEI